VHQRAAFGRGVPLILTHGWPSSFLDYPDMLPMLEDFDVVVPSLPGYGFSPRPPEVGINYRYVSERWHRLMTELGYSRYGAGGNDFGSGVSTFLAVDHPESMMGIHLTTLESDLAPKVDDAELSDMERSYLAVSRGWDVTERGYKRDPVHQAADRRLWTERLPGGTGRIRGREVALVERRHAARRLPLRYAHPVLGHADHHLVDARLLGQSLVPGRPHVRQYAHGVGVFAHQTVSRGRAAALVSGARVQHPALDSLSPRGHFAPVEEPAAIAGDLTAFFRDLSSGHRTVG